MKHYLMKILAKMSQVKNSIYYCKKCYNADTHCKTAISEYFVIMITLQIVSRTTQKLYLIKLQ